MAPRPSPTQVHEAAIRVVRDFIGSPELDAFGVFREAPDASANGFRIVGRVAKGRSTGRRIGLGHDLPAGVFVIMFGDNLDEVESRWFVPGSAIDALARRDSKGRWSLRMSEAFRRHPDVTRL